LSYPFNKCIGIELLDNLFNLSKKLKYNFEDYLYQKQDLIKYILCENLEFVNNNILEYEFDFENTSILFINCKTFNSVLMKEIVLKISKMPKGTLCISTQAINDHDNNWIIIDKLRRSMSWGSAIIYINERI
jgi:hypothetical protein